MSWDWRNSSAIAAWLEGRPAERSLAVPREDQAKALACISDALRTHPRATVVMPCGTGKTLVQLWAAERLTPQTVLVLVPSLALLSQTLGEWSHHTSWGNRFEYLCVCSDPTVSAEQDAILIRSTDVPFHVDTDPAIVRRFLNRPATDSVRVVFSTYQSAPVVARGLQGLAPFDLGIFDEAHKTTGLPGGTFALALDDARLRIRKRLFFTATPRHFDIRRRDREGDFPVVSMDDPAVYGPRAYAQTFADAVALGIICDYRVVVAVIDPAEVDSFAMHHGITLVKGDQQATRWVATQIAVSKAIRETGATRVITFHTRIQQAALFASDTPRGIGQYLDGFIVDHVNGAQRVADRKDILSGFRDAQRRGEERFQELLALKKRDGDSNGRPDYAKHPQLATWLERQRAMKRTDRLSADRIGRLEAAGVLWEPHAAKWEQRFQDLHAFKMREGHCNVPSHYPENPQLGKWLSVQRGLERSRQLPRNRIERLEALGVLWKPKAQHERGRKSGSAL